MSKPLTPVQQRYLDAIKSHHAKYQRFPTVKELQKALGYRSPSGVQAGLEMLEWKGWIERIGLPRQPRGYRILHVENVVCPKGLPVRPGSIPCYGDNGLVGIWTPAYLLKEGA